MPVTRTMSSVARIRKRERAPMVCSACSACSSCSTECSSSMSGLQPDEQTDRCQERRSTNSEQRQRCPAAASELRESSQRERGDEQHVQPTEFLPSHLLVVRLAEFLVRI